MASKRRELNLEELEKTCGGTLNEYRAYLLFLMNKYGAKSLSDLVKHLSDEELKYTNTIGLHVAGTPLPDCPNPDFKLDEWMK